MSFIRQNLMINLCAEGIVMNNSDIPDSTTKIPLGQRMFDSPFLLLFLGLLVMFVFYTIWGMFEILSLPQAQLP